jgi:hypothetical protein
MNSIFSKPTVLQTKQYDSLPNHTYAKARFWRKSKFGVLSTHIYIYRFCYVHVDSIRGRSELLIIKCVIQQRTGKPDRIMCFENPAWCLIVRFGPFLLFLKSLLKVWLQHSRISNIKSTCVTRREETNLSVTFANSNHSLHHHARIFLHSIYVECSITVKKSQLTNLTTFNIFNCFHETMWSGGLWIIPTTQHY